MDSAQAAGRFEQEKQLRESLAQRVLQRRETAPTAERTAHAPACLVHVAPLVRRVAQAQVHHVQDGAAVLHRTQGRGAGTTPGSEPEVSGGSSSACISPVRTAAPSAAKYGCCNMAAAPHGQQASTCGLKLSDASMASSVPVGPHAWLRVAARARRSVRENGLSLPAQRR